MTQSPPTGELVARLRDYGNITYESGIFTDKEICDEAADAITTLERELEDLRAGRQAILPHTKEHALNLYTVALACLKTYGVDPEAEVERLKAVVRQLLRAEYDGPGLRDCTDNDGVAYQSADLAKHIADAELLVGAALHVEDSKT